MKFPRTHGAEDRAKFSPPCVLKFSLKETYCFFMSHIMTYGTSKVSQSIVFTIHNAISHSAKKSSFYNPFWHLKPWPRPQFWLFVTSNLFSYKQVTKLKTSHPYDICEMIYVWLRESPHFPKLARCLMFLNIFFIGLLWHSPRSLFGDFDLRKDHPKRTLTFENNTLV